jgi:hypothetical protein
VKTHGSLQEFDEIGARRQIRLRRSMRSCADGSRRSLSEPEKELFPRIQSENPHVFPDGQLRTFQRRIKLWRRAAVRQMVFNGNPLVLVLGMVR